MCDLAYSHSIYRLAARAMSEFYKIYHDRAGAAMSDLLQDFQGDDNWNNTVFLSHAKRNIEYFERHIESQLLESHSAEVFSARLKGAMFNELTSFWQNETIAQHTRSILPKDITGSTLKKSGPDKFELISS